MSDTLCDILPDLSTPRKRPTQTTGGAPTLHNDGTVSWLSPGGWVRTYPHDVPPLFIVQMPAGRVRDVLIADYQDARG